MVCGHENKGEGNENGAAIDVLELPHRLNNGQAGGFGAVCARTSICRGDVYVNENENENESGE